MPLENQKIVVVGGSSGMGLAAAQALAKTGAAVVIASRSQEKLEAAKASISGEVQTYRMDFTDESKVTEFFTKTGKIDPRLGCFLGVGSSRAAQRL
jgi:NAD(P)-dependent dehydrogenase (short-subunit alcohol dehydrogenase family)